jgi:hypothetical protein
METPDAMKRTKIPRLTFKKWNKIKKLSVIVFKLPRFDWHTIFRLQARLESMPTDVKDLSRISVQLRQILKWHHEKGQPRKLRMKIVYIATKMVIISCEPENNH